MSLKTIASQFVELCNQGKNFDVMHAMYAPDIVSVEASGEEAAGKTPVIQKSERWQANNTHPPHHHFNSISTAEKRDLPTFLIV